jgi:hypothetical protein
LVFTLSLTLLAGVFTGWQGALGVLLFMGLIVGVWTIISAGIDAVVPSQEPRSELRVVESVEDDPYRHPDPTRPQDDETHHPVIDLDNYRIRKGIEK